MQYMFALDMTGEDTSKTGGTFLIEKQADPSAVWARPSDPHSEWGAGQVSAGALRGQPAERSAPGGLSPACARHAVGGAHQSLRRGQRSHARSRRRACRRCSTGTSPIATTTRTRTPLDKTSAAEMENVGVAVATSAWFLASADARDAEASADLIEGAATRRLALEREQGRLIVARPRTSAAAEATEQQVMAAWIKWYEEALDSVLRLPAGGPTDVLRERIARAKRGLVRRARPSGWSRTRGGAGGGCAGRSRKPAAGSGSYFANTSAIGVIRTFPAAMFSFRAPITSSSSSSAVGFSPSYLIGDTASDDERLLQAGGILRDDHDRQVARVEVPLDGGVDLIDRQRLQPPSACVGELADAVPLRVERVAELLILPRGHDVDVVHQVVARRLEVVLRQAVLDQRGRARAPRSAASCARWPARPAGSRSRRSAAAARRSGRGRTGTSRAGTPRCRRSRRS